jgi:hypothetical protein
MQIRRKTKSEKECDDSDEVTDKIDLHSVVYKKWDYSQTSQGSTSGFRFDKNPISYFV